MLNFRNLKQMQKKKKMVSRRQFYMWDRRSGLEILI